MESLIGAISGTINNSINPATTTPTLWPCMGGQLS